MSIVVMGLGVAGETRSNDTIRLLGAMFFLDLTVDEKLKRFSEKFNNEVTIEIREEVPEVSEWGWEILNEGMSIGAEIGTLRSNIVLFRNNIISKDIAVEYSNVDMTTFEKYYDAYLEGEDVFRNMWYMSKGLTRVANEYK